MEALNISCDEFKQMQKEDEKLEKYWKLADEQQSSMKSKVKFVINDGILYRIYRDGPHVDPIEQVCVPEFLVEKVIEIVYTQPDFI